MSPKTLSTLGQMIRANVVANLPKIHKDTMGILRLASKDPDWDQVPTKDRDAVVQYEPPTTVLTAPMRQSALWRHLINHGVSPSDITAEMVRL